MSNEVLAAVIGAIIGVVGGIVGTLLGFLLNERATKTRRQETEDKRAGAVRAVLRLEINKNLSELKDHFPASKKIPVQSHQIWQSQLPEIHASLDSAKIERVHDFYYELYGLKKLEETKVDAEMLANAVTTFLAKFSGANHPLG